MSSRFYLYEQSFGRYVLQSEWMKAEMIRRAELVKARAIALAPPIEGEQPVDLFGRPIVRRRDPKKGPRYRDSFEVRSGVRKRGYDAALDRSFRTERAYAMVVNTKSYARHIEYGTGRGRAGRTDQRNTPRFRVLGRALDAAGD